MIPADRFSPLFTDLYELTMAASYHEQKMEADATFSLFIRQHQKRGYFVSAGLDEVVSVLERFHFSDTDIAWLKDSGLFPNDFLSYLKSLSFTGSFYAIPEGEIFFADEPLIEVTAPVIQAQIIETFLINAMGISTMAATKASRCMHAAGGKPLIDFSLRRTQGKDAGMKVARSSYIAGFSATSNVLAGKTWGIPVSGTMAHSYVTAHKTEKQAFEKYAELFPDHSIFLIDTYDTIEGAKIAAAVARQMEKKGSRLQGVRLDSGDMVTLSIQVRQILNDAGLDYVKIFASSGFDEYKITTLLLQGARIDGFGVGTRMGVSSDAPYVDMVYKLVRLGSRDVRKLSTGKTTLAGKKQVYRKTDKNGNYTGDIIGVRHEVLPDTVPVLEKVMADGKITATMPTLDQVRQRFQSSFSRLDDAYKSIENPLTYGVDISENLKARQIAVPFP